MDVEKVDAQNLTAQQESYLEVENHCCLCGTELVFNHEQNDVAVKIKEQAHCPCCKIQLKEKEFIIH